MKKKIGHQINKLLAAVGYQLVTSTRLIPPSSGSNWAERLNIQTIIDIGSNEGQFIHKIQSVLPGRKIFAFEPLSSSYTKLVQSTKGLNIKVFNLGLGDDTITAEINISQNQVSSSLLPMESLHNDQFPDSKYVKKETIQIKRLDDVLVSETLEYNVLVKIDVQGYEEKVLHGGKSTLNNAAAVIIESSYLPFYSGQWLFGEQFQFLTSLGFQYMGIIEQTNSKETGLPLFGDSIFIKKDHLRLIQK